MKTHESNSDPVNATGPGKPSAIRQIFSHRCAGILAFCSLVFFAGTARAGDPASTGPEIAAFPGIETTITDLMRKWEIPGASLALAWDGKIVYSRGIGLADKESGRQVQPDTRFRICSLTKPITAALTLKLVEEGKLNLDDRAFDILNYATPSYAGALRDPRLNQITIRQLLSHTAGWSRSTAIAPFPVINNAWEPTYYQAQIAQILGVATPASAVDMARYLVGQLLQFAPGTGFEYSNIGYLYLGRLIEQKTGLSYEQAVQQFLAGASVSGVRLGQSPRSKVLPDEAVCYDYPGASLMPSAFGEGLAARAYIASMAGLDAHGGLAMSPIEYLRFMLALDGSGSTRLLQQTEVTAMRTEQFRSSAYGFGWNTNLAGFGIWGGHEGRLPGGSASCAIRSNDGRFQLVAMFNSLAANEDGMLSEIYQTMRSIEAIIRAAKSADVSFSDSTLGWEAWKSTKLGNSHAGANEDPDGDGIANLVEYAAGLDPSHADVQPPASFGLSADETPVLSFRKIILGNAVQWVVESDAGDGVWKLCSNDPLRTVLNSDGTLAVTQSLPGAKRARLAVTLIGSGERAILELAPVAATESRLSSIAALARAGTGEDSLIAGLAFTGSQARTFIIRGLGNLLKSQGVTNTLADPKLELNDVKAQVFLSNNEWSANAAALKAVAKDVCMQELGEGSHDSALLATLHPGAYSAVVTGADGTTGNAMAEVYEVDHGGSKIIALACRTRVVRGGGELTLGFAIKGDKPLKVVLRAQGPALKSQGVVDAISNPTLTVYQNGKIIAQNKGWTSGSPEETDAIRSAMNGAGCYPLAEGSADAAVMLTLPAGAYSMIIAPDGNNSGITMGEIYVAP